MSIRQLVFAAVAHGAPATTQKMAVHLATQETLRAGSLEVRRVTDDLVNLTSTPLDASVHALLREHYIDRVRAAAWASPHTPVELFLAHIDVETNMLIRAAMLTSPHAQTAAVADRLCEPMRRPVALQVLTTDTAVSTAVRLGAVPALCGRLGFQHLSATERKDAAYAMLTLPVSPEPVIVDPEVSALVRLAAAANRRVPATVLTDHLPAVLDALEAEIDAVRKTRTDEWYTRGEHYLNIIAGRDDVATAVVDRVRDLKASRGRLVSSVGEWVKWLDPQAFAARLEAAPEPEVTTVDELVSAADTSSDLEHVWSTLTSQDQVEYASAFVRNPLCDLALYERVLADAVPEHDHAQWPSMAAAQAWCFSSPELFAAIVDHHDLSVPWRWIVEGRVPADRHDEVFGWFIDALFTVDSYHSRSVELWAEVLAHPDFPRDRFDEIELSVLNALLSKGEPAWVVQSVIDRLETFPVDRATEAFALYDSVAESVPFGAAMASTAAALTC